MKKLFLLLLLGTVVQLQASTISHKKAFTIAETFTQSHGVTLDLKNRHVLELYCSNQTTLLAYVVAGAQRGFVVVAAHSNLNPVISYSFDNSFLEDSPLAKMIKADLQMRLQYYEYQSADAKQKIQRRWEVLQNDSPLKSDYQQWPEEGTTSTGGWITTFWHQNAPFNTFTPINLASGQRSVVGCPATAMAQILNFHQTTRGMRFNDNDRYFHQYMQNFWIDDDWETYKFLSFDSLNVYLENIENKFDKDEDLSADEKAALSLAAGFACKTVYTPSVSGTFGVIQAYDAYQRFGFTESVLMDHTYSDDQIRNKMIENIQQAMPVHVAVVDPGWQTGHNVVCDGYRDNGFFRLNMGWGGTLDNWYNIPEGFPYNLTVFEGIVADIQKETQYMLSIAVYPDTLDVVVQGEGQYALGEIVELVAGDADHFVFSHWSGDEEDLIWIDEADSPQTHFTMPDRHVTLTANYTYLQMYEVLFKVLDAQQQPIPDALILIDGVLEELHTCHEGYAQKLLPDGSYTFTVTAPGFEGFAGTFELQAENTTVEILLIPLGIVTTDAGLTVYPNPFHKSIGVESATQIRKIWIYNATGIQVKDIALSPGAYTYTVSLSEMPCGYYFVRVETVDGMIRSHKIIKAVR